MKKFITKLSFIIISVILGLFPLLALFPIEVSATTPLNLVMIDYSGNDTDNTSIISANPAILICNTAHGLWGTDGGNGGHRNTVPSDFTGIKVYSYITGGYEGSEYGGGEEDSQAENIIRIDGIASDGAYGVFIDEVDSSPNTPQKSYITALYDEAHSLGLSVILNTGVDSFDSTYLKTVSDYIMTNEDYTGTSPTASEIAYGKEDCLVVNNQCSSESNAVSYTNTAWTNGYGYTWCTDNTEYNLPSYLSSYIEDLGGGDANAAHTITFHVTDTSGTNRTGVTALVPITGSSLLSSGYINSNGTDTDLNYNGAEYNYLMDTDVFPIYIGELDANESKPFNLDMGYSPVKTNFPIIVGDGGLITTPYNASLELGSSWEIDINSSTTPTYIDTSDVGAYILNKVGEATIQVSSSGELTATVYDGSPQTIVLTGVGSDSYYLVLSLTSGTLTFTVGSHSGTTSVGTVTNNTNDWIWDSDGLVMPYINYVKISTSPSGSYVYVDKQTGSGDSITDTIYQLNAGDLSESGSDCVLPSGYVAVPHSICSDGNNVYIIAEEDQLPDSAGYSNYSIFKIDAATMTIVNTLNITDAYDGQFYADNGTVMLLANGYLYTCISTEDISTSTWSRALYKINTADLSYIDSTGTALQTYVNYGFQALASYNGDLFVLAAGGDACITEVNESSFTRVASNNTTVSHYAADIAVEIPWQTSTAKLLTRDDIGAPQGYPLYDPNYWGYNVSTLASLGSVNYAGTTDNDTAMLTYPDTGGFLVYFPCNGEPDPPYTVNLEVEEWAGSPDFGYWVDTNNGDTDEGYAMATDDAFHVFVDTNNAIYKLNGLGSGGMGSIASLTLTGASDNITYGALSGNPTELLKYQPNTIISGTDLPNLDDNTGDTDGAITWGTGPSGTSSTFGGFTPVTTATAPVSGGGGSPTSSYPGGMPPLTSEGNFSNIPGASVVNPLLNSSDIPLDLFWDVLIFVGILALGFAIMVWTKEIWIVGVACSVGFAIFSYNTNDGINFTGGALPFWTVIVCIMATIIVGVLQDRGVIKI